MKKSVYFNDFTDAFRDMNRKDCFSYEGKKALFEYLEEYEKSCDTEIELDIIALCCEYTEYKDFDEIKENCGSINTMEDLTDNTQVIEFDGGIIIKDF